MKKSMKTIIVQGRECDTMTPLYPAKYKFAIVALFLAAILFAPVSAVADPDRNTMTGANWQGLIYANQTIYSESQDEICARYPGASPAGSAYGQTNGIASNPAGQCVLPGQCSAWDHTFSGGNYPYNYQLVNLTIPYPLSGYYAAGRNITATDLCTRTGFTGANYYAGKVWTISEGIPAIANFSASPTTGNPPLIVAFNDTSSGGPQTWNWSFGDGYGSALQNPTHTYTSSGLYTVSLTVTGPLGSSTKTRSGYINTASSTVTLELKVMDGMNPGAYVADSSVGIRNTTSGTWRNSTASSGYAMFDSTGAFFEYPLSIGELVTLSAGGTGFETVWKNVTIPYSGYLETVILPRTGSIPTTGGTTYYVTVIGNSDGQPINSAVVKLQTGVNGACSIQPGCQAYTNQYGIAIFENVSSSTTAAITAFAQAYQQQSKVVQSNPNGTVSVSFSLVRIGQIPVTTPVVSQTTGTVPTATITPVLTDSNGQIITTSQGKVDYSFGMLIDVIPSLMSLAIGIVEIWFLWLLVYIITGGKIIDKIMRRGRGRGR